MAIDASGNYYLGEVNGARIRKVDAATGAVTAMVGTGTAGNSQTLISTPQQMSFDTSGNLVFGEYSNCDVRRRNSDGSLSVLAGTGTCASTVTTGGTATAMNIGRVWGALMAPNGDLFISDDTNHVYRVRAGILSIIAGTGVGGANGDGGPATAAQVNQIRYLAVDASGNLYLPDSTSNRVRMIDTLGYISTIIGNGTASSTGDGSAARAATLTSPRQVSIDPAGNIFISENDNYRLRVIDHSTGIVSTVAGTGVSGYSNNVTNASAVFQKRTGMAIYGNDVYFVDVTNRLVRRVTGVASTTSNAVTSGAWSVVPPATGHANLREAFTFVPAANTSSSKLSLTVPTSFALTSPTAVENYGLSGTVTPSLSGTTLSLGFTSQSLTAGVPVGISIEGVSNGGASGVWNSYFTLYDSAGTTGVGWAVSNGVSVTATGAPVQGTAGFASLWKRSLSTTQSAFPTVAVSPSGTTDSTSSVTLTNTGSINANTATLSATSMASTAATLTVVSASPAAPVTSASFVTNRWGLQFVTSSGTNATSGAGYFSGLGSATAIATGAGATNVLTVTPRAKIDYLSPAGTYKSTLTWRFSAGV